ncbi:MAG: Asp-tRNA(Asn)/Glu-tRNA(Gln) amidotransferase GatCAB subunit A [Planctomycetaceae bacterium]|nr:Asp-tRNA(Asn)/Glu-tRNA(Gln) amidotransferase GatCAB subunit A [Planctomycetaceae bacterium]
MSIINKTATEQLALLQSREITSVALTQAYLDRINQVDPAVGAFLRVESDTALTQAAEVDRKREAGESLGKLAGLPIAIKDILCTQNTPTTCGSKMLENFVPPYNATVVEKLFSADAVILGRTNMDEFAMGSSTENSAYHPTQNPWDTSRIPGGSSGGAAACIAADMAPLSIGTDTGGSIRQPAALCGCVGLKPTYGRVSRYGLIAFASSLDQIGPLARTVEDTALLMEVLAGHDSLDSTSVDTPVPPYSETVHQPLQNLRLGVVEQHFGKGIDPEIEGAVKQAIATYQSLGATIKNLEMPHADYGIATYYIIAPCEASSNLARYDGAHYGYRADQAEVAAELAEDGSDEGPLVRMYRKTRSEGFGSEVQRRIMLGTYALSEGYYDAFYLKALKVRRLIRQDYDNAFEQVDLIIGPVTANPAFVKGEKTSDPMTMYLEDLYTVTANLAGVAGISLPCGLTKNGLPIGLQLQAAAFQEEKLLRAAQMFQHATDFHLRRPELL